MRVAYVSADRGVPIFGQKGCSLHAQEILSAMLRHGAQVELFSPSADGEPVRGLEPIAIHALPHAPKGEPAIREQASLAINSELQRELASAAPFDFVYERFSLWSFAGMEYARAAGVPGLLEVNAPLIEEQARYRVLVDRAAAEQAAERCFTAATYLLAVSAGVAAWLERYPSTRGKIRIVPNAIRPERFPEKVTPAMPGVAGEFTVGFLGTLKAWHGLGTLLEAFSSLHQKDRATRLLLVGDGPERENIVAELAKHGLQHAAILTGAVPPERVPAFLASMDVAVAPYPPMTDFYFSPLKVYEYMAAGLPVIASRLGQLTELICSGENGLLVAPGDVQELVKALDRLKADAKLRTRLGRAARATVIEKHTWDAVAEKIFDLAGQRSRDPITAMKV